jgi:hypothetical protein
MTSGQISNLLELFLVASQGVLKPNHISSIKIQSSVFIKLNDSKMSQVKFTDGKPKLVS